VTSGAQIFYGILPEPLPTFYFPGFWNSAGGEEKRKELA